ncbi:MAG TPA: NAD(P)H-dependent oxidoreductase [Xanthobacteraceae bacterium]|nr:NAD(P)H-dependent oxidoreductase [Xanthobacteraceae bacterium]
MDDVARRPAGKRILIIQGHPDPCLRRFGHALAAAYAAGAQPAGHEVRNIELAQLSFPLLHSAREFYQGPTPEPILKAQDDIRWAVHLVFVFPIWHGHIPALLHAFLEQTFRPGFSIEIGADGRPRKLLTGKTARLIATAGMPAFFHRWFFGAHSLKSLKRNILHFAGIRPVRTTVIGGLGFGQPDLSQPAPGLLPLMGPARPERALDKVRMLGIRGR